MRMIFKRHIVLLSLLLTEFLSMYAQQVTEKGALSKAEKFLSKQAKSKRVRQKTPSLVCATNRPEFYVFNDNANGGWMIVSGDERMPDVLGYSENGSFDADNIPCCLQELLDGYAAKISYLQKHPEAKVTKRTVPERETIAPMLTCQFAQTYPYNAKCPESGVYYEQYKGRCPTGCVATAMAQILYYHKWPKQTTAVIPSFVTYALNIEIPEIPVTTIDWDNMLEHYDYEETYSDVQVDAISTLMWLSGASIQTNYKPESSGSSPLYVERALKKYFGYDDQVTEIESKYYDLDTWEQIIYDELESNRPVMLDGSHKSMRSAHAWVVDGYDEGYFHLDWGWGSTNAWVLLVDDETGVIRGQGALVGIQPQKEGATNPYSVLEGNKLTLFYDKEMNHRSGTVLAHRDKWAAYKDEITNVVIDPSYANVKLKSFSAFFKDLNQLKTIEGIENLNTSLAFGQDSMFCNCSSLTNLDVSGFNTDHLNISAWMFDGCSSLTSLDVSKFKMDKVANMAAMFRGCSSLTSLDVSGFKTDNVAGMSSLFDGCSSLTYLDVSGFNTENVQIMDYMFNGCSSLKALDVSGFKTDRTVSMYHTFSGCSSLTSLDVSGFKTDRVGLMNSMFEGCSSLTSLDVSGFCTDNVNNMSYMFGGCSSLTSLDVSGFNTGRVTNMCGMFSDCSKLTSIDVSGFNTSAVTNMAGMFNRCYSLTSLDLSKFNTANVTNMFAMFRSCNNMTTLDLSAFNTKKLTNTYHMFYSCEQLSTIYVSEQWDMSKVTAENSWGMFYDTRNLVGGAGTTFNESYMDVSYAHIDEGPSNPGYLTYKAPSTGIKLMDNDYQSVKWYDINGRMLDSPRKGLNIMRKSNGETKKIIVTGY